MRVGTGVGEKTRKRRKEGVAMESLRGGSDSPVGEQGRSGSHTPEAHSSCFSLPLSISTGDRGGFNKFGGK